MQSFLIGLLVGGTIMWLFYRLQYQSVRSQVFDLTNRLNEESKQFYEKQKSEINASKEQSLSEIAKEKSLLLHKERQLKDKLHELSLQIEQQKKEITKTEAQKKELAQKDLHLTKLITATQQKLEEIASFSIEEAKETLLGKAEAESKKLIENRISILQATYETDLQRKATDILFSALERKTQTLTKDIFLTRMTFENRAIISSCIGKEGRNIHTLEDLLGVKLIIEENQLLISSHNIKSRFIAQKVLEELLKGGKISLVRIMAVHDNVVQNTESYIRNEGIVALHAIDPTFTVSSEVTLALGNQAFQSTAGQNLLKHSMEVAEFMGILAAELNLRPKLAKLMGLFHDIGKTLSIEYGDSHAIAGKTFLLQHQLDTQIVEAVASHHGECIAKSDEARLLPICDRLSAQLPGIRTPVDPSFLQLVHNCEEKAKGHPSVLSAWGHYGGNSIELIVRHRGQERETTLKHHLERELVSISIPVHITLINSYQKKDA